MRYIYLIIVLLPLPCLATAPAEYSFSSQQQEQLYHEITQQLRCPQCQNNSIADSTAPISDDMRAKVYQLLQQGKSKQQIMDYMVERYGYFISYQPPVTATTLILWIGPICLFLGGLLILLTSAMIRRR